MKIAISGKGGVGKTTLTACLARFYASRGQKVIVVDADPDSNLATALGMKMEDALNIMPISQMKDLVEERTGAKPGDMVLILSLIPK
ncbi:MAG: AAA family ATPase [Actinomycetota bacterium]|nr:AAA family ATPase [Actinomycetota bacterium]